MLSAALEYAALGWPVFPCKPNAKIPATPHGCKDATTNLEIIKAWWLQNPSANIGIATGTASGLVVLDFDVKEDQPGRETFRELQREHGQLLTRMSRTPSGGIHLLFNPNGNQYGNRAGILPGLDIRGDGGYIVAPGSIIDGKDYAWVDPEQTIEPLPDGLRTLLQNGNESRDPGARFDRKSVLDGVPEGQRDDALYRYVCSLQAKGTTREEAEILVREAAARCKPPFDESKAVEKVGRVYGKYGDPDPEQEKPAAGFIDTDMANSERFARLYSSRVFWTPERGWLIWDRKRYQVDEQGHIMALAKKTARKIFAELEQAQDKQQQELFKWARRSQSKDRLQAMLALAQSEPDIPARITDFDTDPLLLNCSNGVLHLVTGNVALHDPGEKISKLTPIEYDPVAACPLWLGFLDRVMAGDDDMIEFLQRATGYTLTGDTGEQCLFFTHGNGANGKSVFLEILQRLIGEYGCTARADSFMVKTQGSGIPNDIARLAGMRFVGVNETETGQKMAESLVKDLTGGDTISARFLHKEFFDFRPSFKLWIRGNHKPNIRGTDDGIWRRIHLIPFEVQIPEAERDPHLPEKLMAELSGILRWAADGARLWKQSGLRVPEKVRAATSEYRTEMDRLADFIDEKCSTGPSFSAYASNLYKAYTGWCDECGENPISQMAFGLALVERGYHKKKIGGRKKYNGIGLNVSDYQDRRTG